MTVHFVMREMAGFSQLRMTLASLAAVGMCTCLFLTVAVGSLVAFGPDVPADVLQARGYCLVGGGKRGAA